MRSLDPCVDVVFWDPQYANLGAFAGYMAGEAETRRAQMATAEWRNLSGIWGLSSNSYRKLSMGPNIMARIMMWVPFSISTAIRGRVV